MSRKSPKDIESKQSSPSEDAQFDEVFNNIVKRAGQESDEIDLENIDRWFQEAMLSENNITREDTFEAFTRIAKNKDSINKQEFRQMLNELAYERNQDYSELETKLKDVGTQISAGIPQARDPQIEPSRRPQRQQTPREPKKGFSGSPDFKKDPML